MEKDFPRSDLIVNLMTLHALEFRILTPGMRQKLFWLMVSNWRNTWLTTILV